MNPINLDVLTENYQFGFYLHYLCRWPTLMFKVATQEAPVGYMIGKSEGEGLEWHSHITAVTVDKNYRRLGLARALVLLLRNCSEAPDQNCYFIDLFVRTSNRTAVDMYKRLGFAPFRRVVDYYASDNGSSPSPAEDAFDMRRPLQRDKTRACLKKRATTEEQSYYKYLYNAQNLQ